MTANSASKYLRVVYLPSVHRHCRIGIGKVPLPHKDHIAQLYWIQIKQSLRIGATISLDVVAPAAGKKVLKNLLCTQSR